MFVVAGTEVKITQVNDSLVVGVVQLSGCAILAPGQRYLIGTIKPSCMGDPSDAGVTAELFIDGWPVFILDVST